MLSISRGHSVEYLTSAVAGGRENYYSRAVETGEPPGVWHGAGAEALGLVGEIDAEQMSALYGGFLDPRDPRWADPQTRGECAPLPSAAAYRFRTVEERLAEALQREPNLTPERLEELRLQFEGSSRQAVSFIDATYSVQKSVTVLHTAFEAQEVAARRSGDHEQAAAWATHRQAVEAAIWAGNRAALDYLSDVAGYARAGRHTAAGGRFVDAHKWVVGSFFQHTSRDNDPQLHIHNAILNRVECPDGVWRTLDSRAVHRWRGAAGALAERTTEAYLTRALGVRFTTRPDGKAREVVGVPAEVMELFSGRRRAITKKTQTLVRAFEEHHGRVPNTLELDRLQRQATMATRSRKLSADQVETMPERLDRWDRELRAEIDSGLGAVARAALRQAVESPAAVRWSPQAVAEIALEKVGAGRSVWTRGDLVRAVSDALPDDLGIAPERVRELVESLTDYALRLEAGDAQATSVTHDVPARVPDELKLDDGRSAYLPPAGQLYATAGQLAAERALRDAGVERGRACIDRVAASAALSRWSTATGAELGVDQAAAVRGVLTSGAAVEVLVGPAGTGKSRTLGALAAVWSDAATWSPASRPAPRVFGLATSQIAAEVLAGEGLTARNIARWLAAQSRLEAGRGGREDQALRLAAGDLVVVDEASMTDTAAVSEIRRHTAAAGAKLLLTGDHRQLAAVGAGGSLDLAARTAAVYELAEVRRFTAEWERDASLRLREGDLSAVADYARHGRLVDAGTSEQAANVACRGWLADTIAGKRSLLLVDTNEQAAALSASCRAELVRFGLVAEEGTRLEREGTYAGVGDLVQARLLAPRLAGYAGNRRGPINREVYRVVEVRPDGALLVQTTNPDQPAEQLTLPPSYVAGHLTLGYASTVHSAQGLTVDTCHTVVTPRTSGAAAYVSMTRGRECNTAYVETLTTGPDAATGESHNAERCTPAAVLAAVLDGADTAPPASALLTNEQAAEQARSLRTIGERFSYAAERVATARYAAILDQMASDGRLTSAQRAALAADDAAPSLVKLLRTAELAGHDAATILDQAVTGRSLDGARSMAQVIHHRINEQLNDHDLTPRGDNQRDRLPTGAVGQWADYLDRLAELADHRTQELGQQAADAPPQWAVEAFGPVPDDPTARQTWQQRAGAVAAHREWTGWDDPAQAIGPAPGFGAVEQRASWHAAWRALGRPEATAEEAELSDGALRVRVRAYQREEAWAPAWVGDDLATTAQAAARYRQDAVLAAARAKAAEDAEQRSTAELEAAQAEAMAATLAEQQRRLEAADQARGAWYAHTAVTRETAHRARAELERRGVPVDNEPDRITAEEWLAAQAEAIAAEDPHRLVGPGDLAEEHEARRADLAALDHTDHRVVDEHNRPPHQAPATQDHERVDAPVAAPVGEPTGRVDEPVLPVGVPTMADTAAQVLRARQALHRLASRRDLEARRVVEEETHRARLYADADGWQRFEPGRGRDPRSQHHQRDLDDEFVLQR